MVKVTPRACIMSVSTPTEPHTCMLLFLLQNHSDLQLFLTVRVRRSITQCKQMAPRLSLIKDKLWVKQSSCCSVVLIS